MPIGVYRLYVGSGWTGERPLARLTTVLDRIPGFLYRVDRVADDALPADTESLRALVRIALTQAHVAIMHPDELARGSELAVIEAGLAREGFRRRIPILGVSEAVTVVGGGSSPSMDRLCPLEPGAIASALQDLAEEAAAERRRASEALLGQPLALVGGAESRALDASARIDAGTATAATERGLPIVEIMASLARLRAARGQGNATS